MIAISPVAERASPRRPRTLMGDSEKNKLRGDLLMMLPLTREWPIGEAPAMACCKRS